MLPDEPKMQNLFSSVPKGNLRPVCRNQWTCFKHNIYYDLMQTTGSFSKDFFSQGAVK